MGLLSNIIIKGVTTAARNSTIKAVGSVAVDVMAAKAQNLEKQEDSVVKNGILYIKPTRSSEKYLDENTFDIVQELLGVGFENINLKEVKILREKDVKKYGKIHSITINGKDEFLGIKKLPSTSYIVIEYLDFKEKISSDIYSKVRRLKSGLISGISDVEYNNDIYLGNADSDKRYCSNCGELIQCEKARFCSSCGKEL